MNADSEYWLVWIDVSTVNIDEIDVDMDGWGALDFCADEKIKLVIEIELDIESSIMEVEIELIFADVFNSGM